MVYKLNKEEQAMAMNLAMHIDQGVIKYDTVLKQCEEDSTGMIPILCFWLKASPMTKQLVIDLYTYKARKHLENCLEIS